MDLWLHQMIALERRERWLRAAAAARAAGLAGRTERLAESPLAADSSDPSAFVESLLAPMPVPRVIWWRDGIGRPDETRAQRSPRR